MLGRPRQLYRSQIDALIRYPGFQVEAVDTGYLTHSELLRLGRSDENRDFDAVVHPWHVHANVSGTFQEVFFRFPPDARWNPECSVVEFGLVWASMKAWCVFPGVFQFLLLETRTPERCLEAYHLHRTRSN